MLSPLSYQGQTPEGDGAFLLPFEGSAYQRSFNPNWICREVVDVLVTAPGEARQHRRQPP
jgi:hypothetical protein